MAIHIIFGPGGSGKSLFQMLVIERQLRETRRNIVTNLAIDVPLFAAWLEKRYPTEDLDPGRRIRILTVEETREFWKIRGGIRWTGQEYDCEVDKGQNGVCYVIDEAGAAGFDAGGWASSDGKSTRGVACSWYLDQQRKFGDDVFASTNGRAPHGIAKPFRDKAHYFIKLKNGYQTSYGMFRARGRFQFFKYTQEPVKGTEPAGQGVFHFGSGIEDCYHTEQGVGVVGSAADKGSRAKGLSPWWLAVAAAVLALAVGGIPKLLGMGAAKYVAPPPTVVPAVAPSSSGPAATGSGVGFTDTAQAVEPATDKVLGMVGRSFAVSWADGWQPFDVVADTPERAALLVRYAGWRRAPTLERAQR